MFMLAIIPLLRGSLFDQPVYTGAGENPADYLAVDRAAVAGPRDDYAVLKTRPIDSATTLRRLSRVQSRPVPVMETADSRCAST